MAAFNHCKARFFAQLMREGYDLPIDLVQLFSVNELLRAEIGRSGIYLQRFEN